MSLDITAGYENMLGQPVPFSYDPGENAAIWGRKMEEFAQTKAQRTMERQLAMEQARKTAIERTQGIEWSGRGSLSAGGIIPQGRFPGSSLPKIVDSPGIIARREMFYPEYLKTKPEGSTFIRTSEAPTYSLQAGYTPTGYWRPPQTQRKPTQRTQVTPFRSSRGGESNGFSAPSADFNIRANLGGLKPMIAMPADPTMSGGIASELARARQRTVVNMARQEPYSLWGR